MNEYSADTYGESISEKYDDWFSDVDPLIIEYLCECARGGKALELGIGTGRVAIPLREKDVDVYGIDASPAMVAKMHQKPHGTTIPVTIQSFAEFHMDVRYDLVYVVFNTFFGLLTQTDQVSCLQSVAEALTADGCFVIEAFVPDLGRFDRGQSTRTSEITPAHIRLECSQHDLASQSVISQIVSISPQGIEMYPIKIRYAWPSEIDLMAQLAGLTLVSRWGDWQQTRFSSQSGRHISTYTKV
jgi:predicted TPR repeat methyltransferase